MVSPLRVEMGSFADGVCTAHCPLLFLLKNVNSSTNAREKTQEKWLLLGSFGKTSEEVDCTPYSAFKRAWKFSVLLVQDRENTIPTVYSAMEATSITILIPMKGRVQFVKNREILRNAVNWSHVVNKIQLNQWSDRLTGVL